MWESILQMTTEYGIWAALFVLLFFKQLKDSKVLEENYQATINRLAEKLKMIAEIKTDIEAIRESLPGKEAAPHQSE